MGTGPRLPKGPSSFESETVTLKVTPEFKKQLFDCAYMHDKSLSAFVKKLITEFMEKTNYKCKF